MKKPLTNIRQVIACLLIMAFCITTIIIPPSAFAEKEQSIDTKQLEKTQSEQKADKKDDKPSKKPDRLIIKYKVTGNAKETKEKIKQKTIAKKIKSEKSLSRGKIEILTMDTSEDIEILIADIKSDENIEYVQPDYALESFEVETNAENTAPNNSADDEPEIPATTIEESPIPLTPEPDNKVSRGRGYDKHF